jgi:hypothetical protein
MSNKQQTASQTFGDEVDANTSSAALRHPAMTVSTQSSGPWRGFFEKVRAPHVRFGADVLDGDSNPDRWIVELVRADDSGIGRFVVGGHLEVGQFDSLAHVTPSLVRLDWAALSGHEYRHPVDTEWVDEIRDIAARRIADERFPGRLTVDLVVTDAVSSLSLARISASVLSALLFASLTTVPSTSRPPLVPPLRTMRLGSTRSNASIGAISPAQMGIYDSLCAQ